MADILAIATQASTTSSTVHGNDYYEHNADNDKLVTAVALGIKELDTRHLHTIETEDHDGGHTSLKGVAMGSIIGPSTRTAMMNLQVFSRKTMWVKALLSVWAQTPLF